jgi:hypothetical protein
MCARLSDHELVSNGTPSVSSVLRRTTGPAPRPLTTAQDAQCAHRVASEPALQRITAPRASQERLESLQVAAADALWTDGDAPPPDGEIACWEIWLRTDSDSAVAETLARDAVGSRVSCRRHDTLILEVPARSADPCCVSRALFDGANVTRHPIHTSRVIPLAYPSSSRQRCWSGRQRRERRCVLERRRAVWRSRCGRTLLGGGSCPSA